VDISGASVTLIAVGTNTFWSRAYEKAGIECSSDSNVTLWTEASGSFVVTGGTQAAGIGAGQNGRCGWVTVVNGSVDSRGGTGIGSGWVWVWVWECEFGASSGADGLTVHGAHVRATWTSYGAGIGSGHSSSNGNSIVWNVAIMNANINVSSSSGSGIASGFGH
jgi:hypothetical protein